MTFGELFEKLECIGEHRDNSRVRLRVQSREGFVWADVELTSVEEFTDAPDIVLQAELNADDEGDLVISLSTE